MTKQESDRERIAALERKNETLRNAWQTSEADRNVLLDRLAAVERERDDWKDTARAWIAANAPGGWIDDLRKAESALLSLQNAVRTAVEELTGRERAFRRKADGQSSTLYAQRLSAEAKGLAYSADRFAALLPDTTGTDVKA